LFAATLATCFSSRATQTVLEAALETEEGDQGWNGDKTTQQLGIEDTGQDAVIKHSWRDLDFLRDKNPDIEDLTDTSEYARLCCPHGYHRKFNNVQGEYTPCVRDVMNQGCRDSVLINSYYPYGLPTHILSKLSPDSNALHMQGGATYRSGYQDGKPPPICWWETRSRGEWHGWSLDECTLTQKYKYIVWQDTETTPGKTLHAVWKGSKYHQGTLVHTFSATTSCLYEMVTTGNVRLHTFSASVPEACDGYRQTFHCGYIQKPFYADIFGVLCWPADREKDWMKGGGSDKDFPEWGSRPEHHQAS
jgi:hypothetical protein